ncbi:MAG: sulfotransferase [Rhodobacteraceae bacterium]|nr:sulfotransferase [Paracoccaceae bacterium]
MTPKDALRIADKALAAGDTATALKHYRAVLARLPRHAAALKGMRRIERLGGLAPVTPDDYSRLVACLQSEDFTRTEAMADALILRDPNLPGLYNVRGLAQSSLGRDTAALASFRKAVALDPLMPEAAGNLGQKLRETGDPGAALLVLEPVARAHPNHVQVQFNLATIYEALDRLDDAEARFDKAVALAPGMAAAWLERGKLHALRGRREAAIGDLERSIALDPTRPDPYIALIRLQKIQQAKPLVSALEGLAGQGRGALEEAQICFALGKAYEDMADYARAFDWYARGNDLQKTCAPYDEAATRALFDELKAAPLSPLVDAPLQAQRPVFITGMNRSGTSLVEQILASHSMVHGGGEISVLGDLAAPLRGRHGDLDRGEATSLAATYCAAIAAKSDLPFVTDKMPANFRWIGLIRRILPEARIILVERDVRDVCFSNFKASFESAGHMYAYDQQSLARYYAIYADLVAHWKAVFGDALFVLKYEDLVADPEPVIRRLLGFIGLDWEDQVMEFHRSGRAVRTLSQAQVTSPIYDSSINAWRNFEPYLGPMLDELAAAGL